jgi:hypothetical protein
VLAVARALLDRDAVLGIVPIGTANLMARDLEIPLDPMLALDTLLEARPRRIDVGRVNSELFLCASMLGMAMTLARVRESGRGEGALRLWPRLLGKALRMLWRYPHRRIILQVDGRVLTLRSRTLVITNNPLLTAAGAHRRLVGRSALALARLRETGLDLALGGHVHLGYAGLAEGVVVAHAGTGVSSRLVGELNGFNLITGDPDVLTVEHWRWRGHVYAPDGAVGFQRGENGWRSCGA